MKYLLACSRLGSSHCLGLHPWHHPSQFLTVFYLLLALLLTFTFYYNQSQIGCCKYSSYGWSAAKSHSWCQPAVAAESSRCMGWSHKWGWKEPLFDTILLLGPFTRVSTELLAVPAPVGALQRGDLLQPWPLLGTACLGLASFQKECRVLEGARKAKYFVYINLLVLFPL